VVADGQRIYLGAFTTCECSMSLPFPALWLTTVLVTNQRVEHWS